jgi:hypothetical protein
VLTAAGWPEATETVVVVGHQPDGRAVYRSLGAGRASCALHRAAADAAAGSPVTRAGTPAATRARTFRSVRRAARRG